MQTIDIPTTQNVTIQYELASAKERFIAALIDISILAIATTILSILLAGLMLNEVFIYITLVPLVLFWSLAQEYIFKGQTIGKKLLKIRVMRLDGEKPELFNYIARWAFRLLDIYLSSGAVGIVMIKSSGKSQRLGDVIGNTVLVRLKPTYNPTLESISNMINTTKYTPVYPAVIQLSEQDILLIKETLDRSIRYNNNNHKIAVVQLATKIHSLLNISEKITNPAVFLKTIMQDYVVVTR